MAIYYACSDKRSLNTSFVLFSCFHTHMHAEFLCTQLQEGYRRTYTQMSTHSHARTNNAHISLRRWRVGERWRDRWVVYTRKCVCVCARAWCLESLGERDRKYITKDENKNSLRFLKHLYRKYKTTGRLKFCIKILKVSTTNKDYI